MMSVGRGYPMKEPAVSGALPPKGRGRRHASANDLDVPGGSNSLSACDQVILNEFFSPMKSGNDTVILVGSQRIYVNKSMLVWISDRFHELIFPDYSENSQIMHCWAIDSSLFTFHDIFEMVKCIFPCPATKHVDGTNVAILLKISFQFGIKHLTSICRQFLANSANCPHEQNSPNFWFEFLHLAAHYNFLDVVPLYLTLIAGLDIHAIRSKYASLSLSPSLIALILDFKMGVLHEEMKSLRAQQEAVHFSAGDECRFGPGRGLPTVAASAYLPYVERRIDGQFIDPSVRVAADCQPIRAEISDYLLTNLT